jgi:hypothetical protein
VIILFVLIQQADAFYVDNKKSLEFKGKAQTRVSFRLQDSEGWTYPPDISVGDLVQWRNLATFEIDHDLKYLTRQLDILYPLKALKIRSKYHIVGRFMYEAVYNVGPEPFRDVRDQDKENIDNFKQAYDLWECYLDLSRGPAFIRIGRQNLAWGETDLFRLLDGINPLDNTFGGPFEDLDDRRIPLWMIRGSYGLGRVGPISSFSIEGFWVPGNWDTRVAPFAPPGTPYFAPFPELLFPMIRVNTPAKTMSNSRWGARLQGILLRNVNFSVGHYQSFIDAPALKSVVDESKLVWIGDTSILASMDAMTMEAFFPPVQITGASLSFFESRMDAIVRAEAAWFWDEPVFIPQINLATIYGPTLPLPPALLDIAAELLGADPRDLGMDGVPLNPQSGEIPKKNIFRYMIGIDKQIWIRALNKTNTFMVSLQSFGQWIPDYDDRLAQPVPIYPDIVRFPALKEYEHTFTALIATMYRNGTLNPQMALAYDVRGAWLVQPQLMFIREPFRFMVQYSMIAGNFTNFGAFRDRDQITFTFTYLLN